MHPQSSPQGGWECHYKVIVLGQLEPKWPACLSTVVSRNPFGISFTTHAMFMRDLAIQCTPQLMQSLFCSRGRMGAPLSKICTLGSSWTLCLCSHRLVDHLLQTHSWSCINAIRKCSSKNLRVRKPSFVGFVPGLTGRNFGEVAMLSSCSNSVTAASNALVALFDLVLSASTL